MAPELCQKFSTHTPYLFHSRKKTVEYYHIMRFLSEDSFSVSAGRCLWTWPSCVKNVLACFLDYCVSAEKKRYDAESVHIHALYGH